MLVPRVQSLTGSNPTVALRFLVDKTAVAQTSCLYSHVPHNNVPVNGGPHIDGCPISLKYYGIIL
jgi:hypothetical protein